MSLATQNILIKNGRVLDPASQTDCVQDVLISDGVIQKIAKNISVDNHTQVIDLASKEYWVCPGLVDIHVHFREPGQGHKETIATGSQAALAGGFTSVATMPNTKPVLDNLETLEWTNKKIQETSVVNIFPVAAATIGLLGQQMTDIQSLVNQGVLAFSDDGNCVMNAGLMRRILEYCASLNVPFLCHAEDTNLSHKGVMNESHASTCMGLHGMPNVSESVIVARDIELARLTGAHVHFCHISASESIRLIRLAKAEGLNITAEVTPHHLALSDTATHGFNTNAKMNPPLRAEVDKNVLIEALCDGTIDCVATDHAPHSPDEKERAFAECPFGVVGLETAVGVTLSELYHTQKMTALEWVNVMSAKPAKILNLNAGKLQVGQPADITIIDPSSKWVVDPGQFKSKSRNTPFTDQELTGQAVATIVAGELLFQQPLPAFSQLQK